MKTIQIDASPKQLSRLRNGHRVRVKSAMAGTGFNMIVDPSKFDSMTRAFTKGTAVQVQLTPEELMANREASGQIEGEGIFKGGRIKMPKLPSTKKIGRTLNSLAKKAGSAIVKAEKAVRKNPTSRALVKKILPLVAQKATEGLLTYAGADPATAKAVGSIGKEGATSGLTEAGYGLYAGASSGRGMYAGGALPGPRSRTTEMSSLAIGGSLMRAGNPNLVSDAMSANFSMNTQLMPQYQRGGVTFR